MESMIVDLVKTVGIPAAMALYVLIEMNKTLKELTRSIERNTRVMTVVLTKFDTQFDCEKELNELIGKEAVKV